MVKEISYSDLKCREVINCVDGRRLGRIVDIVFSGDNGKIMGIVLPYARHGFFSKQQDLFIPWQCVKMLGTDVILVEIIDLPSNDRMGESRITIRPPSHNPPPCPPPNHAPPPPQCPPPCPPPQYLQNSPSAAPQNSRNDCCQNQPNNAKTSALEGKSNSCDDPAEVQRARLNGCDGKCEKCMLFECANRWGCI